MAQTDAETSKQDLLFPPIEVVPGVLGAIIGPQGALGVVRQARLALIGPHKQIEASAPEEFHPTGAQLTYGSPNQVSLNDQTRYKGMFDTVRDAHHNFSKGVELANQAAVKTILRGAQTSTRTEMIKDMFNTARVMAQQSGTEAVADATIGPEQPGEDNMDKINDLQRRSKDQTTQLGNLLQKLEKKIELVGQKMTRKTQQPIVEAANQRKILDLTEGIKKREAMEATQKE